MWEVLQPSFFVCLVILVVSAVMQVKYLNKGMQLFANSEVIPTHYVCFTLCAARDSNTLALFGSVGSARPCPSPSLYRSHFLDDSPQS